jgi:hypothetical protein
MGAIDGETESERQERKRREARETRWRRMEVFFAGAVALFALVQAFVSYWQWDVMSEANISARATTRASFALTAARFVQGPTPAVPSVEVPHEFFLEFSNVGGSYARAARVKAETASMWRTQGKPRWGCERKEQPLVFNPWHAGDAVAPSGVLSFKQRLVLPCDVGMIPWGGCMFLLRGVVEYVDIYGEGRADRFCSMLAADDENGPVYLTKTCGFVLPSCEDWIDSTEY